jgi:uncharacterized membrane protein YfcA
VAAPAARDGSGLTFEQLALAGVAALAAGAVNALAGGGTLITFPALTAIGLPAISANVTSTIALCPGYLGGSYAQRADLRGQERRLRWVLPAGVFGGVVGAFLLLSTGERLFRELVPWLLLLASALLAAQNRIRAWLLRQSGAEGTPESDTRAALPLGVGCIYGGYFGAGLGVVILAVLGLAYHDSLTRLNALKQMVSLATNTAAALFLLFSDQVVWSAVAVMAVAALAGGSLGGRLAGRIRPERLRAVVVSIGVIVAAIYFVR